MITDKDREEIISLLSGNYSCGRVWSAWQYGTMHEDDFALLDEDDSFIDDLLSVVDRIRAESAEQTRKEAAENGIIFMQERLVPGVFTDIMLDEMRAAILGETVKEGKTDAEKLAIAVKALENISGRGMTGGGIAKRALKEIQ